MDRLTIFFSNKIPLWINKCRQVLEKTGLFVATFGIGTAFLVGYYIFLPVYDTVGGERYHRIMIPFGATATQVGDVLKQEGLIRSTEWFRLYARLRGLDRHLCPGFFIFDTHQSLHNIVSDLGRQEKGHLVRITIPEGTSIHQIGDILEKNRLVDCQKFIQFASHARPLFQKRYPFLQSIASESLEGYLFPDTYFFAKGEDTSFIVDAMLYQFFKKIGGIWSKTSISQKKLSFHQALTMASMLEEEAQRPAEMPIIASVFFNRLKIHMPLASDPTVIYALGQSTKAVVTYNDLKIDSAYNTYRVTGLPPTPISSPGETAFRAVLHAADTPYLFFVADREGGHLFSTTYRQHLDFQKK